MTGTFPGALKQGRTAMPYHSGKRALKREKLSAHKLWPQRRTVNPQKQCAADEKTQRGLIEPADRKFAIVCHICGVQKQKRKQWL